jgi:hypothetical protein
MATKTKFLELEKPELLDAYSEFIPGIFGSNMDKLDEAIGFKGTLEIIVDSDTKRVCQPINGGKYHVTKAILTLRVLNNDATTVQDVELPNIQVYSLYYHGDFFVVLQSDVNIPQGTYYVDWIATGW